MLLPLRVLVDRDAEPGFEAEVLLADFDVSVAFAWAFVGFNRLAVDSPDLLDSRAAFPEWVAGLALFLVAMVVSFGPSAPLVAKI
jgi:hypothetical protein